MPRRTVYYSSLTNKIIDDETDVVRVVVERHPALEDGQPVELDVSPAEADEIVKSGLDVALLRVHRGGATENVIMDIDEFNKLAADGDMEAILQEADAAYIPARKPASSAPPKQTQSSPAAKIDYSDVRYAGAVKRGIVSEAEKETVRNHLDQINKRLRSEGQRTIDLNNPDHVAKYGLESLVKEASNSSK